MTFKNESIILVFINIYHNLLKNWVPKKSLKYKNKLSQFNQKLRVPNKKSMIIKQQFKVGYETTHSN